MVKGRPRTCKYSPPSFKWISYSIIDQLNPCVTVRFAFSNKPNPNQLSVNSVKPGLVNGAGAIPGAVSQPAGLGRACESCYSRSLISIFTNLAFVKYCKKMGKGLIGSQIAKEKRFLSLSLFLFVFTATSSYQWYSWGPTNMQCRLCASCWTYWKKYGGLKMPTRLDGERPGPNRNNMVRMTRSSSCTDLCSCIKSGWALC